MLKLRARERADYVQGTLDTRRLYIAGSHGRRGIEKKHDVQHARLRHFSLLDALRMSQGKDDCRHDKIQKYASNEFFPQRRKMGNSRKRPLNAEDFARMVLTVKKIQPTGQQGQQQVKELEILGIQKFHRKAIALSALLRGQFLTLGLLGAHFFNKRFNFLFLLLAISILLRKDVAH